MRNFLSFLRILASHASRAERGEYPFFTLTDAGCHTVDLHRHLTPAGKRFFRRFRPTFPIVNALYVYHENRFHADVAAYWAD